MGTGRRKAIKRFDRRQALGLAFGFLPVAPEEVGDGGEWRVWAMPGNTLAFYPPWEEGL